MNKLLEKIKNSIIESKISLKDNLRCNNHKVYNDDIVSNEDRSVRNNLQKEIKNKKLGNITNKWNEMKHILTTYDCKELDSSLSSTKIWEYTDMGKHSIGTIENIIAIALKQYDTIDNTISPANSNNIDAKFKSIYDIFLPYFNDINNTSYKDLVFNIEEHESENTWLELIKKDKDKDKDNRLKTPFYTFLFEDINRPIANLDNLGNTIEKIKVRDISDFTKNLTDKKEGLLSAIIYIHLEILNSEKGYQKQVKKKIYNNYLAETLLCILYSLFESIDYILTHLITIFKEKAKKLKNLPSYIYPNMLRSLEEFRKLYKTRIVNFGNIESEWAYGIKAADKNNPPKAIESKNNKYLRVIGGIANIKNIRNIVDNYPIKIEKDETTGKRKYKLNVDDTRKNLLRFIINGNYEHHNMDTYSNNIDVYSKKLITMGGPIQYKMFALYTFEIIKNVSSLQYNSAKKDMVYIDSVLQKMQKSIHISSIKKLRKDIKDNLEKIAITVRDKDLRASGIINNLKGIYMEMLINEADSFIKLITSNLIYEHKKDEWAKHPGTIDLFFKEREKLFIIFSQNQIKAAIFRVMALNIYKQLSEQYGGYMRDQYIKRSLPMKYYNMLEKAFDEADNRKNQYIKSKTELFDANVLDKLLLFMNNKGSIRNIKNINMQLSNIHTSTIDTSNNESIYWKNIIVSLGGKTIYVPWIRKETTFGITTTTQYGIFNLLETAFQGTVEDKYIISGDKLNVKYLAEKILAEGMILVTNTVNQRKDPRLWRCVDYEFVQTLKSLDQNNLRNVIKEIFKHEHIYARYSQNYWAPYGGSRTKEKVIQLCRLETHISDAGELYKKCRLLLSREEIEKKF